MSCVRRAFGPTIAKTVAAARALQLELRARGFVSSVHFHDRLSGLELFYFFADVASQRAVERYALGRFLRAGAARLWGQDKLLNRLCARVLATGYARVHSR